MPVQLGRGLLASGSVEPVPNGRVLLLELPEPVAWEPTEKKGKIILLLSSRKGLSDTLWLPAYFQSSLREVVNLAMWLQLKGCKKISPKCVLITARFSFQIALYLLVKQKDNLTLHQSVTKGLIPSTPSI